jgi:ribosomal protein S18 acetylase RimI-like enzyme
MTEHAFRLRKNLDRPIPPPKWPPGFSCRTLMTSDAPDIHSLLEAAYAEGPGVPGLDAWWTKFSSDPEFDASLCFLVFGEDRLAAVALCWTSAFLKDLAVHPEARKMGFGSNLLRQVFHAFRERHTGAVDLKVEAGNVAAIALYQRVGMYRVPWDG